MAAQYKTRCPHCQAQFRIGEQHLRQAKGRVRCGSCLKVFLATEHLVPVGNGAATSAAGPAPRAATGNGDATRPATNGAGDAAATGDTPAQNRWTLNEEEGAAPAANVPERIAYEDDEGDNDTRVSLGGLELSDSFLSLDGDDDDDHLREDFSDMAGAASGGSSTATDESWAEQLLEELDAEDEPLPSAAPARREGTTASPAPAVKPTAGTKRPAQAIRERDEWMEDLADPFGSGDADLLSSLPDEGLSMGGDDHARRAGLAETLRWSLASLALIAVFAVQYALFEFDTLARHPALRPLYAAACERLPCTLPPLTDITALRASNLVVRPHPAAEDAVMVDLLLHNRGPHAQPYPDLELGFTSLDGQPVASRRFTPDEYLHGEADPEGLMPVATPVHISLELVDPGPRAVNYILRPLPPATATASTSAPAGDGRG